LLVAALIFAIGWGGAHTAQCDSCADWDRTDAERSKLESDCVLALRTRIPEALTGMMFAIFSSAVAAAEAALGWAW